MWNLLFTSWQRIDVTAGTCRKHWNWCTSSSWPTQSVSNNRVPLCLCLCPRFETRCVMGGYSHHLRRMQREWSPLNPHKKTKKTKTPPKKPWQKNLQAKKKKKKKPTYRKEANKQASKQIKTKKSNNKQTIKTTTKPNENQINKNQTKQHTSKRNRKK